MLSFSLLLAASVAAAPAMATPTAPTRTVSVVDLNLASPAGRARLDRRIDGAVRDLCGSAAPADLRAREDIRQCRVETLALVPARRAN